jgi:hypothetical protein
MEERIAMISGNTVRLDAYNGAPPHNPTPSVFANALKENQAGAQALLIRMVLTKCSEL